MEVLADYIRVLPRFSRSANLERDSGRPEPLDGYIVTARALDAITRITAVAAAEPSGGAWSLTGPYGSGKSSLALVLDAAFGPASPTRDVAWKLIGDSSPHIAELMRQAHQRHQTLVTGFHRGLVTANREPLSHTVLRGLHKAVLGTYGEIPPATKFRAAAALRGALKDAATHDPRRTGPSPAALVEVASCLASDAPLLLVIDEFGKNLEAIRDSSDADPYLLQQLAEAGQGVGLPIFMLTLQHLSFEDYLADTDGPRRREWAKVQGRFENIAYVESGSQSRALIGTVFEVQDDGLNNRIDRWARVQARTMRSLGIADLADPDVVASCYPLHPLAAAILPELCNRYGQHERTLFSFLTSPEPASAAFFLEITTLPKRGQLPSIGLDTVYDYFVASGTLGTLSARQSSRWTEVATRLRDTHGLSKRQTQLAKTIAILNLVSTTGVIRASRPVLAHTGTHVNDTLAELEAAGIVTYRDYADEYRLWQGTDIDIRRLLDAARRRVQLRSLVDILSANSKPRPVVAARHSAKHDVLRVFSRRYVDGSERIEPLDPFSPYDGEALLVVGSLHQELGLTRSSTAAKPTVAAIPQDLAALDQAAREVAAVTSVLEDPSVKEDWVARRELGERLAETRIALEHSLSATFSADACMWVLLEASGVQELRAGRGSTALSQAADATYPFTPTVRNEMLNRTALTSQGAKARRLLLKAMIERGSEPGLGLDGYGPEVAMYRAFLERTGLHRDDSDTGTVFRKPADVSLQPAWQALEDEFNRARTRRINLKDIYAALLSPPVGMKAGVIPVFVTAALLAFNDEIAIYEHGTFIPLLTPEISERMVRNPRHFDVKHFANTTGARQQVVRALAERLGVRPGFHKHRVANVLAIVGHLVSQARRLDNFTLRTRSLRPATLKSRDILLSAVEPDELLFGSLPKAFGFPPAPPDAESYAEAGQYAEHLAETLGELRSRYDRLLSELLELLLETAAETSRLAVTGQAAALENEVLNPEIRAFVLTLANESVDTDEDWINAIATVVAKKAPAEWADGDKSHFQHELARQLAAFQRLVALHAERRADGRGPFSALRVAFTRPDGSEHIRLVGVDCHERDDAAKALDSALEELVKRIGSPHRAQQALLAILGERLLPEQTCAQPEDRIDSGTKRIRNG